MKILERIKENAQQIANLSKEKIDAPEEVLMLCSLGLSYKHEKLGRVFESLLTEELTKFFNGNKTKTIPFVGSEYVIEEETLGELLSMGWTVSLCLSGGMQLKLEFEDSEQEKLNISIRFDQQMIVKEYIQYMVLRPAMVATIERFLDYILETQESLLSYVSATGADERMIANRLESK